VRREDKGSLMEMKEGEKRWRNPWKGTGKFEPERCTFD